MNFLLKEEKAWRRFIDSLEAVNNISIDRCIVIHRAESIELHAFSDTSEKAYGSSIYLKSISALGEVKVCLVTSKSRVSPLKQISIPRLELCGAVLAAKLMKKNPADVLSRGLLPEELRDDYLWWHGPELLLQSAYSTTVISEPTQRDDFDCELRVSERTLETSLLSSKNFDFFSHLMDLSNNYFKIIHIVSYIYRFIESCISKVKKRVPLITSEVNDAETWLIKQDQRVALTEVTRQIKPLAENNKGNSDSLEKMEFRLSEYSPTERKVDDREGQCNVWYNGEDLPRITLSDTFRLITEKNTHPLLWCSRLMFSTPQYPVFIAGCSQRDTPDWTAGVKKFKLALLSKMATDLTAVKWFILSLVWQFIKTIIKQGEWAQNEIAVVPDFHKRILFSDEVHFWLNGYVNKQNCRIWSEANPQVYVETPLHPEKLTVWCALWAGGIIGPYFFKNDEGHNVTVNGDRYRAMMTNFSFLN
ncbi:integrase catalytic domain-containing protein [Trichonephila clavipes]|nr:integrase catalytic domain-containing protein [Trichonephila clavipes]